MLINLKNGYSKKYFLFIIFFIKNLFIFFLIIFIIKNYKKNILFVNYNDLIFNNITNKIKIGIVSQSLKNGGCERQTSLILNYLEKIRIFEFFLITKKEKEKNEYLIDKNIERIIAQDNLIPILFKKKIEILIYQLYDFEEIQKLQKLKNLKIIFINRSCFLHWIYYKDYYSFKTLYKYYRKSKYIISLIPFENDYLFKRWGIKSILMNNFITYEFKSIEPSDLSSKIILMIGRGDDKTKRFDLGIKAMKYIIEEIPETEMRIISKLINIEYLKNIIKELNLESKIQFVGYTSKPEIYYKNASLHLFPTLVEAFPNILSETLIYGIPNILVGLDYVSTAKGGSVIIYNDSPFSIAKVAIKILKNNRYRKKLGREARKNMKKYKNEILAKKWINLLLSIYKGDNYYNELRNEEKKINDDDSKKIIENQIILLKQRNKKYQNITIQNIQNFTYLVDFLSKIEK